MKTKRCTKCGIEKPLSHFHKRHDRPIGIDSRCKLCLAQKSKLYCTTHKEELRLKRIQNRDVLLKQSKNYRDTHKEKIRAYRQLRKNFFNLYIKQRKQKDVNFKLRLNLRGSMNRALKENWKAGHTLELTGCSIKFLKQHLEAQFQEGMNWNNWGKGDNGNGMQEWHIDHIRPCASFDLSDPKQQEQCFHYTNLQPLWAKINMNKHDKRS